MQVVSAKKTRQTKYAKEVYDVLVLLGHASNLEIQREVQKTFPEVSATTIHRVTARLKEQGMIGSAPMTANGAERYDATTEPHHHFMCENCEVVCDVPDTDKSRDVMMQLKKLSGQCEIAGSLTMRGLCKACARKEGYGE